VQMVACALFFEICGIRIYPAMFVLLTHVLEPTPAR
jgi:hypothetical protein